MELLLPSFPISNSLPRISSSSDNLQNAQKKEKVEPTFSLTSKIQIEFNSESGNSKRDKEGTITLWADGPSIEYKIKKKRGKEILKKSKLEFNGSSLDIKTENWTITVWSSKENLYKIIAAYYLIKQKSNSKKQITLKKGDGNTL